jgi:hypothetical protein
VAEGAALKKNFTTKPRRTRSLTQKGSARLRAQDAVLRVSLRALRGFVVQFFVAARLVKEGPLRVRAFVAERARVACMMARAGHASCYVLYGKLQSRVQENDRKSTGKR